MEDLIAGPHPLSPGDYTAQFTRNACGVSKGKI
jgi:hypothetical protein